jgi:hypothetical protein
MSWGVRGVHGPSKYKVSAMPPDSTPDLGLAVHKANLVFLFENLPFGRLTPDWLLCQKGVAHAQSIE